VVASPLRTTDPEESDRERGMRMRRLTWFTPALLMAFALAACAPEDPDPAVDEPVDEEEPPEEPDEEVVGDWSEPLTVYIPAPAGGGFDIAVRALQPVLAEQLGNDVIPENVEGAAGAIAAQQMLGEPADGNRVMIVSRTIMSLPYTGTPELDPLHDFAPVGITHQDVSAVSVATDSEFETLEDLIEYARENPGEVTVGTSGVGGVWHSAAVVLAEEVGVEFDYIPYDGGRDAGLATAAGEVDVTTIGAPETLPFVEDDSLRMLAVLGDEREEMYPDVPTAAEEGYDAQYVVWRGFVVPADTPDDIRLELEERLRATIESDDAGEAMEDAGFVVTWQGSDEFAQLMEEEDRLFVELYEDTDVIVSQPER
jgi:tripartite-type tricarboxylate transporter receptor subunit TctC